MAIFDSENGTQNHGILEVSDLSSIICEDLDDPRLQDIKVRGEISNLSAKGHHFFSLGEQRGDKKYLIDCVMWKSNVDALMFKPKDGMMVIAYGSVQVYEPRGKYQLYVREMEVSGTGDLYAMVERWKTELTAEGIFSAEKMELPEFPTKIGVVTSPDGAVIQDIQNVISRRFPVEIVLSPTVVQGDGSHKDIAAAISRLDGMVDVIIVGRGGGSFEDLFAFNHPDVVYAIAECETPIVSAVGHETDYVLSDFAADVRAPTPSAAAELVVPDRATLLREIRDINDILYNSIERDITQYFYDLEELNNRLSRKRIDRRINEMRQGLADRDTELDRAFALRLNSFESEIRKCSAVLAACNPASIMARGYCITKKGPNVVRSVKQLRSGDRISLRYVDGKGMAKVEEMYYDKKEGYR